MDGNVIFMKQAYDNNYDLSKWTALQKNSPTKAMVCIFSKTEPLEGISAHVEKMLLKCNIQTLR